MLKCIKQEGHFGEEEKVFEKEKAKIQTKTKLLAVVETWNAPVAKVQSRSTLA